MFPYRDDNPTLASPVATFLLIGANLVMWVVVQGMGSEPSLSRSVCELGLIPGEFLGLVPQGATVPMGPRHFRYLTFYVLCGLAAAAAQTFMNPASPIPMVGASGAISGVMGAYIVLYPKVRVHMLVILGIFITRIVVPAYLMLGYWFLLQIIGGGLASSSEGGVAFWAHAGGFIAGALLIQQFKDQELVAKHRALARTTNTLGYRER
jgi:membrane associated rhomboid family serine protease